MKQLEKFPKALIFIFLPIFLSLIISFIIVPQALLVYLYLCLALSVFFWFISFFKKKAEFLETATSFQTIQNANKDFSLQFKIKNYLKLVSFQFFIIFIYQNIFPITLDLQNFENFNSFNINQLSLMEVFSVSCLTCYLISIFKSHKCSVFVPNVLENLSKNFQLSGRITIYQSLLFSSLSVVFLPLIYIIFKIFSINYSAEKVPVSNIIFFFFLILLNQTEFYKKIQKFFMKYFQNIINLSLANSFLIILIYVIYYYIFNTMNTFSINTNPSNLPLIYSKIFQICWWIGMTPWVSSKFYQYIKNFSFKIFLLLIPFQSIILFITCNYFIKIIHPFLILEGKDCYLILSCCLILCILWFNKTLLNSVLRQWFHPNMPEQRPTPLALINPLLSVIFFAFAFYLMSFKALTLALFSICSCSSIFFYIFCVKYYDRKMDNH